MGMDTCDRDRRGDQQGPAATARGFSMNGDGPFGVPKTDVTKSRPIEEVEAFEIAGDTVLEISLTLGQYSYEDLRRLMVIFGCEIGDLATKIAKAKGIKNVTEKN